MKVCDTLKVHCVLGIGWLLAADLARAGPSFVTDDPEPPPPGGWEINVPFILERTPGTTDMDAPLFDLNYGLPEVQLKLEVPVAIVHEDSDATVSGVGDLLLGVKWRFWNNEQLQLQFGVYPQLLLPTGDHARGLRDGRSAFVFPLLGAEKLEEVDALRQHRVLVANCCHNARLRLRRRRDRT